MRNLSIVLAVLVAIPFTVLAQNQSECYNTVTFCPIGKRLGFTRNMQSFSGAFEQGDTSEFSIVVYKLCIGYMQVWIGACIGVSCFT